MPSSNSNSNNNNNNNNNADRADSTVPRLPHQDLMDNIRRSADHHIRLMLHSLIGLPSMLSVPPAARKAGNTTWPNFEDEKNNAYAQRTSSSSGTSGGGGSSSSQQELDQACFSLAGLGEQGRDDGDGKKNEKREDEGEGEEEEEEEEGVTLRDREERERLRQQRILALSFPLSFAALDLYQRSLFNACHNPLWFDDVFGSLFGGGEEREEMEEKRRRVLAAQHPFFGGMGLGMWNSQINHHPWVSTLTQEEREELFRRQERRQREVIDGGMMAAPFWLGDEVRKRWEREHERRRMGICDLFDFDLLSERGDKGRGGRLESKKVENGETEMTELDSYEHMFGRARACSSSWNNGKRESQSRSTTTTTTTEMAKQYPSGTTAAEQRYVIATSTSSSTRTLPDGSSHTRTETERRYSDGSVDREVKEFSTPGSAPALPAETEAKRIELLDDKQDEEDWEDFDEVFGDEEDDYVVEGPTHREYRKYAVNGKIEGERGKEEGKKKETIGDYERDLGKVWDKLVREEREMEMEREGEREKKRGREVGRERQRERESEERRGNLQVTQQGESGEEVGKKVEEKAEQPKSGGSGWFWRK